MATKTDSVWYCPRCDVDFEPEYKPDGCPASPDHELIALPKR